jgi:hypothetical protein
MIQLQELEMAVKADAAAQAQKLIFEATAFPQPAERLGGWSMLNCFIPADGGA